MGFSFDVQLIVGVPFLFFRGRDLVTGMAHVNLFGCLVELGGYNYVILIININNITYDVL